MESRLDVLVVVSVMDDLGEEVVGLVETREAALELSDMALNIPCPVGEKSTSLIVSRRCCNGFSVTFGSSSVHGCSVVGLACGDAIIPLPSLPSGSK